MSTNEWVCVKTNKCNMANIKLSEMIKNNNICYYCLVNKCRNNSHNRRNTKLKRCRNYFGSLINNPCNLSSDFSKVFNKAIEKNILKKYKLKKGNFYITTCTSPLINKCCYNERNGNTFNFKYKGKTFTSCHKNPKKTSGKLPICLHCDFTRVNQKVDIIPVKKKEAEKKNVQDIKGGNPEKKEEKKKTDPNSWAGKINKLDETKEKTEEIKDFFNKVTPFKKVLSFNVNEENEKKDLVDENDKIKELEEENKMLKEFISQKYDESIYSNFSEIYEKEESCKLESLIFKKHSSKNNLIDVWHKEQNNLITVFT